MESGLSYEDLIVPSNEDHIRQEYERIYANHMHICPFEYYRDIIYPYVNGANDG